MKLAEESLERNGFDTDDPGNNWSLVLGVVDPVTRAFTQTDPSLATAVKVTLTSPIDWSFQPGGRTYTASGVGRAGLPSGQCEGDCTTTTTGATTTTTGPTTTTTVPKTDGQGLAGIAVGSFLARVSTSGGLLKDMFGKFLNGNVTLVGYTGIAAGSVSLGRLQAELGFGTVNELLTTQVKSRDFLLAMVTVLQNKGDAPSIQAATDLRNVALATDSNLNMRLGDMLKVAQGAEGSAATAEFNALQLATMVALANGQNAVDIALTTQNMGSGLSSILSLTGGNSLRLKVIEPPQIAYGPPGKNAAGQWLTVAKTAQVRAQIHLRPLGNPLGLGLLDLPIYVEAASAKAALRSITCQTIKNDSTVVVHTDAQAVKAYVGNVADISASGTVTVNQATLLDLLLTDVRGLAQVNVASSNGNLSFNGPFNWSNTKTIGYGVTAGNLLQAQPVALSLAGLNLGGLLSAVAGIINPVLTAADSGLINNLLGSLGVSLGGGDVTNYALDCTDPELVG